MPTIIENLKSGSANILGNFGKLLNPFFANLKWVVAFIAVVAVTSAVSTCHNNGKWEATYKAYYDSTRVLLKKSDSMETVARNITLTADSLRNVAAHQTQRINYLAARLQAIDDSNKVLNDSLDKLVATLGPLNPITCAFCLRTNARLRIEIDSFKIQVDSLQRRDTTRILTIDTLRSALRLDTVNINRLQGVIDSMPKPKPPPHLFGIFHLNPNQAFVAGAVVTIGSMFILRGKL